MTKTTLTGNQIRQQFIDFFVEKAGTPSFPPRRLSPAGMPPCC